jgi:3-methyladenine DNA glycosylase AlkD
MAPPVTPPEFADAVTAALTAAARPERASAMAAYVKDVAPFFGVATPGRRAATRTLLRQFGLPAGAPSGHLLAVAAELWGRAEREHQYVAADLLRHHARHLTAEAAERLGALVTTRAWWDSVDALGPAVRAGAGHDARWVEVLDRWAGEDDRWLRRVALLSQLGRGTKADVPRLLGYIERNAADGDVFIRKAIGWALRDMGRHHPDTVRQYVAARRDVLSTLSQREALKHLGRLGYPAVQSASAMPVRPSSMLRK